jgi:glutamine cyclotransferase
VSQQFFVFSLACLSLLFSTNAIATNTILPDTSVQRYDYEILAERSHKKNLFTQGLIVHDQHFYESSGLYKRSWLVSYPIAEPADKWAQLSAKFTQKHALQPQYFAEGLTLFNDKLYLLTWQEQQVLVYNRANFVHEASFTYQGEGWGLTHDNTHLIRSDGSHQLTFHNPQDFSPIKNLTVHEHGRPLEKLTELEFFNGKIWANVWYQNRLVEIDPSTGNVTGELDLSALVQQLKLSDEAVLNGIAYDAEQEALWVTGKFWPRMFLLKIKPSQPN